MSDTEKKTHSLSKSPSLNLRYLADYMAASEQKRRTILRSCKYRPIARVIQHADAKLVIFDYIQKKMNDPSILLTRAESIKEKLTADQFDEDTNRHNADYIIRFAEVVGNFTLPECDISQGGKAIGLSIEGLALRFDPALRLSRTTKTNKLKAGALMFRYQKGKPLPVSTGLYQSAAILGALKMIEDGDGKQPEGGLCATVDAQSGAIHYAPSNAIYMFNEMKAACASIAERWDSIAPPKNAVF